MERAKIVGCNDFNLGLTAFSTLAVRRGRRVPCLAFSGLMVKPPYSLKNDIGQVLVSQARFFMHFSPSFPGRTSTNCATLNLTCDQAFSISKPVTGVAAAIKAQCYQVIWNLLFTSRTCSQSTTFVQL